MDLFYETIVIGAGHAGCEAALISAKLGINTLIITMDLDTIAAMSCNPSIGGPAKGQIVREIDVLGGQIAKNTDKTYLQIRQVNTGRGPAVRTLRVQSDKFEYKSLMKKTLEEQKNLDIIQGTVRSLIINKNKIEGVVTLTGIKIKAKKVIISTGTFLNGIIHIGKLKISSGRMAEKASIELAEDLKKYFEIGRLKTGTPPRIDKKTINYDKFRIQKGEFLKEGFSHYSDYKPLDSEEQKICYVASTNLKTHEIIEKNMHLSPLYSGEIHGTGPRYCPSIEDKVKKFKGKNKHKVFIEPEGENVDECYLQGLSSSLPEEVQYDIVHSIEGLENAEFYKPAYAIEYDYIFPQQLYHTLETKKIEGLYLTGQINGTSGYEEAACQGLIAGINASLSLQKKDPFVLSRTNSYIGILIDDLVSRGTNEPYRMFTARAENRLLLRHNNAIYRLFQKAYDLNLLDNEKYNSILEEKKKIYFFKEQLKKIIIKPDKKGQEILKDLNIKNIKLKTTAYQLAKRPEINIENILKLTEFRSKNERVSKEISIEIKYEGYIKKEIQKINKIKEYEKLNIPENIDYKNIKGIATEAKLKFIEIKPANIAQAFNISGVNPVDIYILIDHIRKKKN